MTASHGSKASFSWYVDCACVSSEQYCLELWARLKFSVQGMSSHGAIASTWPTWLSSSSLMKNECPTPFSPKIMMAIVDHNTNIYNAWCNIMESVDSICRNNADSIMIIQKNLIISKMVNFKVFMVFKTLWKYWTRKTHKWPKYFSFFLLLVFRPAIRERGSVLYLGMATEILNLP